MLSIKCDFILSDGLCVFEISKHHTIHFLKIALHRRRRLLSILFETPPLKGSGGATRADLSMGY